MLDWIIFLIIGIIGIIFTIVVLVSDTEVDDNFLIPILSGLIMFGLIGALTSYLLHNIFLSLLIGGTSWAVLSIVIIQIRKRLESEPTDYKSCEGEEATVNIGFSGKKMGNVTVIHPKTGERIEFPSKSHDSTDLPFEKGDKVYIKRLSGMIAEVEKSVKWEIKKMKEGGE